MAGPPPGRGVRGAVPTALESTDVTNKADLCHYVAKSEVAGEGSVLGI